MLAVQLGDAVTAAIVAAVATASITLVNTALGRRANRAKDAVTIGQAQVDTAVAAMDGMKELAEQVRIERDDLRRDRDDARHRIRELERDLAEERAEKAALEKLIEKHREGN